MNIPMLTSAALVGALTAALLLWLCKKKKIERWLALGLFIAVQLIWSQVYGVLSQERLRDDPERVQQLVRKEFDKIPLMVTLQQKDPVARDAMENTAREAIEQGLTTQQAIDQIQVAMAEVIGKRTRFAPDDDINQFMTVTLQQMQDLQAKGDSLCFKLLFPQAGGGIDPSRYNPPELIQTRMTTDNQLVLASYEHPQSNSAEEDLQASLQVQRILQQLGQKYGDDLKMLVPPQRNDVDHKRVCQIATDFYQQILALPPVQSAQILRVVLAAP
ncbi:hypothetical protein [Erwinia sp. V71]|uniref:hypothetical protein n=1 Tax=Erwinia sp. V71 TaxID=3369424 RepID=UPI003F63A618